MSEVISNRKIALLEFKEQLLNSISSCERRIEEALSNRHHNVYLDNSDSSDSESDIPALKVQSINLTCKQLELKAQQLKTCLQATQELTSLELLQYEVNVMVEPPTLTQKYKDEELEPGLWREVNAECKVDLVGFVITFYVHQPHRKFSAPTYHNINVQILKPPLERELARSVLSTVVRPSDAVQILRSYAQAHRSRRQTLSMLTEKYANGQLHMEVLPEGGYLLKCVNMLELSWKLENKWSPIASFYHRLKFDIEYMDEEYIKTIKHSHRQLRDPAMETDDRTFLLIKIIDTCIMAKGCNDTKESIDSEDSMPRLNQRRTTLDHDQLGHQELMPEKQKRKDKDSEVMAPPKSLPKKAKKSPQKQPNTEIVNEQVKKKAKNKVFSEKNGQQRLPIKEVANEKAKKAITNILNDQNCPQNRPNTGIPNEEAKKLMYAITHVLAENTNAQKLINTEAVSKQVKKKTKTNVFAGKDLQKQFNTERVDEKASKKAKTNVLAKQNGAQKRLNTEIPKEPAKKGKTNVLTENTNAQKRINTAAVNEQVKKKAKSDVFAEKGSQKQLNTESINEQAGEKAKTYILAENTNKQKRPNTEIHNEQAKKAKTNVLIEKTNAENKAENKSSKLDKDKIKDLPKRDQSQKIVKHKPKTINVLNNEKTLHPKQKLIAVETQQRQFTSKEHNGEGDKTTQSKNINEKNTKSNTENAAVLKLKGHNQRFEETTAQINTKNAINDQKIKENKQISKIPQKATRKPNRISPRKFPTGSNANSILGVQKGGSVLKSPRTKLNTLSMGPAVRNSPTSRQKSARFSKAITEVTTD